MINTKTMDKTLSILHKQIDLLATSDEFLEMCQANGFKNLNEIVKMPTSKLLEMPLFEYRMLSELGMMLEGYGVLGMLRED